jgi:hypothetical protein
VLDSRRQKGKKGRRNLLCYSQFARRIDRLKHHSENPFDCFDLCVSKCFLDEVLHPRVIELRTNYLFSLLRDQYGCQLKYERVLSIFYGYFMDKVQVITS